MELHFSGVLNRSSIPWVNFGPKFKWRMKNTQICLFEKRFIHAICHKSRLPHSNFMSELNLIFPHSTRLCHFQMSTCPRSANAHAMPQPTALLAPMSYHDTTLSTLFVTHVAMPTSCRHDGFNLHLGP
ncbi:hypothetical protein H5410_037839 [Solanum commersonii]|uniref:Uncharacterized protein n=1 Tax=Solanum commersonii TaxID=4109 RepID=A0A9J5Y9L6_SOLCO|nr:hypothetical protein H5410_037839 [Solanum commersonii]